MVNKYRNKNENAIDNVNKLRGVTDSGDKNLKVKKVAVILSGSRNGSSLLKSVLSESKDIAYLAGEEEPYIILSKNGFPYNSDSDEIKSLNNKQHLLDCMFDEIGTNSQDVNINDMCDTWYNRLMLQMPLIDKTREDIHELFSGVFSDYISDNNYNDVFVWEHVNQLFLKELFKISQSFGYYDVIPENTPYILDDVNRLKIEEPPYVIPSNTKPLSEDDLENKTLFFKTPQDCYRIGMFEELFPNAEIKYIHLTRGYAQTVNGLMDGWLSETGFFAHNMDIINERLNIKGYTDKMKGGDQWWNFDLPPNWKEYKDSSLGEVCLNQWHSAHTSIVESGVDAMRIKFEDFLENPQATLNKITNYLEIDKIKVNKLPIVMITHSPSPYRWFKRKDTILKLSDQSKVRKLMKELNYSMNSDTWI